MAASMPGQSGHHAGNGRDGERPIRRIPVQLLLCTSNETVAEARYTSGQEREGQSVPPLSPSRNSWIPVSTITKPVSDGISSVPITSTNAESGGARRMSAASQAAQLEPEDSTWRSTDLTREPRAPRPIYSEEQKFFIMFTRIIQDHSWPEIEDHFAEIFGQRTKGGLTSVYYRVRKDWGLAEVLKSGPGSFAEDCRAVETRALNFSAEFLRQIGYLSARR